MHTPVQFRLMHTSVDNAYVPFFRVNTDIAVKLDEEVYVSLMTVCPLFKGRSVFIYFCTQITRVVCMVSLLEKLVG